MSTPTETPVALYRAMIVSLRSAQGSGLDDFGHEIGLARPLVAMGVKADDATYLRRLLEHLGEPAEPTAVLISWTESERGWGHRPDGVSLHLTRADATRYIANYWAEEKARNPSGQTPDEYSRPDNETGTTVVVGLELYKKICEKAPGLRLWASEYREHRSAGRIKSDAL